MSKNAKVAVATIAVLLMVFPVGCKQGSENMPQAERGGAMATGTSPNVHAGTYDSRAIAFAYWRQEGEDGKPRFASYPDQIETHKQVFSIAPPVQALDYIKDKLPGVMKEAGVEVIVSKWDMEELAKYNPGNLVDITDRLVKLYNPSEEVLRIMKGFETAEPVPLDSDFSKM